MSRAQNGVELAAILGQLLSERGWTLSTAESCTGGLLGHWLTEVSGSSGYYMGGVIAYADEVKRNQLGVSDADIARYGAVSEPVARAMAQGICQALSTEIGLSVTGIAGPTGGTAQKPVGTVYLGVSSPMGVRVEHHVWPHDRSGNKTASALRVLEMAIEWLRDA